MNRSKLVNDLKLEYNVLRATRDIVVIITETKSQLEDIAVEHGIVLVSSDVKAFTAQGIFKVYKKEKKIKR